MTICFIVECNCFDHATVCEYDAVVDANSQSLNVAGEYSGGGVCIDCQNNTAGININENGMLEYVWDIKYLIVRQRSH